jgi:hypothetical protein
MANDEEFDESELAEGFDEELEDDAEGEEGSEADDADGEEEGDDEAEAAPVVVSLPLTEDDDDIDDADVEMALDEVLAETIMRTTITDDDEEAPVEVDPNADPVDQIIPKQEDEFRCSSCRLLKKQTQLANKARQLCRDCV